MAAGAYLLLPAQGVNPFRDGAMPCLMAKSAYHAAAAVAKHCDRLVADLALPGHVVKA
jgi:hypothetical protein